jgi:hypothetical protein
LRAAPGCLMIDVRQAGSFHTGRSAQSSRRRKPVHPVTSVTAGLEPPVPRGLRSARLPPCHPGPRGHGLRPAFGRPPCPLSTFQHHAPRPPRATTTHGNRLDRSGGTLA